MEEQRVAWRHVEDYDVVTAPLPEGSWSADPEIRKTELELFRYHNWGLDIYPRADALSQPTIAERIWGEFCLHNQPRQPEVDKVPPF